MQLLTGILLFLISLLHFRMAVLAKVRGVAGVDYPNYSSIPKTSFKCSDKHESPGFYADFETRCQIFHYCYEHRKESFLCPEGTTFNEAIKSCDYWYSSECDPTENTHEIEAKKREKIMYSDAPEVTVKVQTNHIFDRIAALYEPKEQSESSVYDREAYDTGAHSKDSIENENPKAESSDTDLLQTQGAFFSELNESSQTDENIRDFVEYEYDSKGGYNVDIIFHDSSSKPSPHKKDNNEVDMSNIGFLSETETERYPHQDTIVEEKQMHQRYSSGKQTELFTTGYTQTVDTINFSDHVSSETLLSKRLSDAPRKKRFRRKPTYVVLQTTQELDGLNAESTGYGAEDNQPIKNVPANEINVTHFLYPSSSASDSMEVASKFEDDFVQLPVRKLRQNRKTFGILTDESSKGSFETTKLVEEYRLSDDKTSVNHFSNAESPIIVITKAENKSEGDIKISIKKPKRNKKTFGMFVDELDQGNVKTIELDKEYQASRENANKHHSLYTKSSTLDAIEAENKPGDLGISVKRLNRNRKALEISSNESNNVKNETELVIQHQDSIMPANIMSPSLETDAEPIFVSEHGTDILTIDSTKTSQPAETQATELITMPEPDLNTTLEVSEKESEEKNDVMENLSDTNFDFHKLRSADTDVMTEQHDAYETEPEEGYEDDMENDPVSISDDINSGIGNREYSEQDKGDIVTMNSYIKDSEQKNFDNIENMNLEGEGLVYLSSSGQDDQYDNQNNYETIDNTFSNTYINDMFSESIGSKGYSKQDHGDIVTMNSYIEDSEHENSDNIENMNSEGESLGYLEQDIVADDNINKNSEVEDLTYPENELNSDVYSAYKNSETGGLAYSEEGINPDIDNTHIINDHSRGIYSDILSSSEQEDQYDNQNNYETIDNTFSNTYINDMLSHSIIADSNKNNYIIVSPLSPITTTGYSSAVNVLDDNDKPMYENPASFEGEQTSDVEYDPVYHTNSEHEEKEFIKDDIHLDIDPDISSLFDKDETKYFDDSQSDHFDFKNSHESLKDQFSTEATSQQDVYIDYVENIELNESVENSYSSVRESFPGQEATDFKSTPSNSSTGISNHFNSSSKESFKSSAMLNEAKEKYKDESVQIPKILDSFENLEITEKSKDEYAESAPFAKIPEEQFKSSTFTDDLNATYVEENSLFEKNPQEFFGSSTFKETVLAEDKLYGEVEEFHNFSIHSVENENVTFDESEQKELEENLMNIQNAVLSETGHEEKLKMGEEKTIDSMFHSSSMPLPANIFEQGLYKQSLREEENVPINRDKRYPVTFYRELDGSSEKTITGNLFADITNNKKYRSLNFDFPSGETNSENTGDVSAKYREPSIFSLLGPSQTIKRLFSTNFPGLKSETDAKTLKPLKLKKLVSFGKNLLAVKRAKLNDFKVLFDLFLKHI